MFTRVPACLPLPKVNIISFYLFQMFVCLYASCYIGLDALIDMLKDKIATGIVSICNTLCSVDA